MKDIDDILAKLRQSYPATFYSRNNDPFKVLVTTVISQRNRDESTARAAEKLFSNYETVRALAGANVKDVEQLLKNIGLYRQKSKRIIAVSKIISEKYGNKVPDDIDELLQLPGVGRKTANCVLVYAFKQPAIPVDIHVHRISNRLGLVKTKTPEQTEKQLTRIIPKKYWVEINELLVKHGQNICKPLKPQCLKCPVTEHCNYYKTVYKK